MEKQKRNSFSGSIGFVLAAAGSAVAVSLSGSKGRRRAVSGHLSDSGADVWFYAAGDGDCDWQEDQAESIDRIQQITVKMGIFGSACLSGTDYYPAVLLCNRRLGAEIFSCIPHW